MNTPLIDTLSESILDEYNYKTDPVLQAYLHEQDRQNLAMMKSYDENGRNFGEQLVAHQQRVAKDGADFLLFLGYNPIAAENFRAAMVYHDIGKTHSKYPPGIWLLPDRPTPEQKALQKEHARLGAEMYAEEIKPYKELNEHPHSHIRKILTQYHHERLDRQGPESIDVKRLPRFVQVACIVDAYDGDMIHRPHQPTQRTPQEALLRMAGLDEDRKPLDAPKYKGAFDPDLLKDYIAMKSALLNLDIL